MIKYCAFSVWPTRSGFARIDAFVRDASFVRVAVLVRPTTKCTHVVQTDVTQETVVVEPASEKAISLDAFFVEGALVVASADWKTHVVATSVAIVTVVGVSAGHGYWKG